MQIKLIIHHKSMLGTSVIGLNLKTTQPNSFLYDINFLLDFYHITKVTRQKLDV
jgi:hypothetical protein